jgi:hypothetical protein
VVFDETEWQAGILVGWAQNDILLLFSYVVHLLSWPVYEMITLLEYFRRMSKPGRFAPLFFGPLVRQL